MKRLLACGFFLSCVPTAHYTQLDRQETLAMVVRVLDEEGRPLPGAEVDVRPGRIGRIVYGVTDGKGEFSFLERFYTRGVGRERFPPYILLDVRKEGHVRKVICLRTENYLQKMGDREFFKPFVVRLEKGTGTVRVDLSAEKTEEEQ